MQSDGKIPAAVPDGDDPAAPLLRVEDLTVSFESNGKQIHAVNDVGFSIHRGEILGIVGESGCGKSVTALSVLGLIPSPPGRIEKGRILFHGENLLSLSPRKMREVRGARIAMIFQDPLTCLNPVMTVGEQMGEIFRYHRRMRIGERLSRVVRMLGATEVTNPEKRINQYPHELSGGLRQRVMIGMGLSCQPELLIADEPTTALDVTVQSQVLSLMRRLCREYGTALVLITHDMGVIAGMCSRVAVMYAGKIVETADVDTLFKNPAHPYTKGLLGSIPRSDKRIERLVSIEGQPPRLDDLPPGCPFTPRCSRKGEICTAQPAPWTRLQRNHGVACHFPVGDRHHG